MTVVCAVGGVVSAVCTTVRFDAGDPSLQWIRSGPLAYQSERMRVPSDAIRRVAVEKFEPGADTGPTWREAVIGLAVPPALMVAAFVAMLVRQGSGPFGAEDASQAYIGIVLALLVAVACAVVTVVLARRYALGRGRQWGWGVFNFLVGPAGVLLLWGLRDWPARQACHGCGVMRVVDRDRCEHCDAQFPPPVPDGTEIFE